MEENDVLTENYEPFSDEVNNKKFCTSCGAELDNDAVICPACGENLDYTEVVQEKGLSRLKTNKKFWMIFGGILGSVLIGVLIYVLIYFNSLRYYWDKVNDLYPFANCGLGSDFIELDTNFIDKDPDYMTYPEYISYDLNLEDTIDAIKFLNEEFGFSSSVYNDMMKTNSLMDIQVKSNSKYTVSWSYSPSEGLEVTYRKR